LDCQQTEVADPPPSPVPDHRPFEKHGKQSAGPRWGPSDVWDEVETEWAQFVQLTQWDCQVFISVIDTPQKYARYRRGFDAWSQTLQWRKKRMVPAFKNFIREGKYETLPVDPKPKPDEPYDPLGGILG
jgi:hypothetical protein